MEMPPTTRTEAVKEFFKKAVLPVAIAGLLYCIFKSACIRNGELDLLWLWMLCGLPFGIHRMCVWIVPGGDSLGGGAALFVLNFVIGGIIGGVLTAIVYCKRKGVNFWLLADTIAPCLAFGQMLGRWGNFFNREAFGGFTNGPLAMRLQVSQVRTSDISAEVMQHIVNYGGVDYIQVHPTFLYESLWNLCLFLLLIKFRPKKKFDGQVLGLYFLGYALGRVWIEGLRTDQLMFGPFAVSQLLSGVLIICAAVFLIRKGKQEKAKKESES